MVFGYLLMKTDSFAKTFGLNQSLLYENYINLAIKRLQ